MMTNCFPNELIEHTFSFFNEKELDFIKKASKVCKKWNTVALNHPIYINAHTKYQLKQAVLKGDAEVVEKILKEKPESINFLFDKYYCIYTTKSPTGKGYLIRTIEAARPSLLHITLMKFIEVLEDRLDINTKESNLQQYLNVLLVLLKSNPDLDYEAEIHYTKWEEIKANTRTVSFPILVKDIQYYSPIYPIYFYVTLALAEIAIKKNDLMKFYENIENLVDRITAKHSTNKEKKKILLLECLNNLKNKKSLTGPLPDALNIEQLLSQNSKISDFLVRNSQTSITDTITSAFSNCIKKRFH